MSYCEKIYDDQFAAVSRLSRFLTYLCRVSAQLVGGNLSVIRIQQFAVLAVEILCGSQKEGTSFLEAVEVLLVQSLNQILLMLSLKRNRYRDCQWRWQVTRFMWISYKRVECCIMLLLFLFFLPSVYLFLCSSLLVNTSVMISV